MNIFPRLKIKSFLDAVLSPIKEETPFFFMFLLFISVPIIRLLISDIHYLNFGSAFSLLFESFFRAFAITYLISLFIKIFGGKKKLLKSFWYLVGLLLFGVFIYLQAVFKMFIQPNIIMLLGETTLKETREFFSTFLLTKESVLAIILILLGIFIVYIVERRKKIIDRSLSCFFDNIICRIVLICILFLGTFQLVKGYAQILACNNIDELPVDGYRNDVVTESFYSLYSIRLVNKEMHKAIVETTHIKQSSMQGDSLNVIYVIGESYIKHHSQLYGYDLPTTPLLQKEKDNGNLFIFKNVITPYNYTSLALKNTFSINSFNDNEKWSDYPFFPAIFKKAGFNVYFWDAQRGDEEQFLSVFSLNSFLYNKEIKKIAYTQTDHGTYSYDDELINNFENSHVKRAKWNLFMFHLWGQHHECAQRYPHINKFNRFSAKDIKRTVSYLTESKKQAIAEYDNATYYNDYVVEHIINLFRNENTVLVYFSDHGEEIYDYQDSKGRTNLIRGGQNLKKGLECQYSVPFVIWCSDKFKNKNPKIMEQIRCSLTKPFSTDNVSQLVFYLSGLKTSYYNSNRNILSPTFKIKERILGNGMNYDKIMNSTN